MLVTKENVSGIVKAIVEHTAITDMHTHLFAPDFGDLMLAGVDELVTYHYLIAEALRVSPLPYNDFWKLSKKEQANFIWKTLFIENSPISEATRGVLTVLQKLGMDLSSQNLDDYRKVYDGSNPSDYIDRIFQLAGVDSVVMTNDPFDKSERDIWNQRTTQDDRFHAALRIDPLVNDYQGVLQNLLEMGYRLDNTITEQSILELKRFISEWIDKMGAIYVAVSLPDTFIFPDDSNRTRLIEEVILPVCLDKNIPFAMMIGVKRAVNTHLKSAGDSLGKASIQAVEDMCSRFPKNKFMITMLSRENQHELAVTARKFRNLMVFGNWWFLNNPSLIEEITRMRFELLGTSIIPQHSDARILDQLVYKWSHSRQIIAQVLVDKYEDLLDTGWKMNHEDIQRDVKKLFSDNFWEFINLKLY